VSFWLVRNTSSLGKIPTSGNDNHETLLMKPLVIYFYGKSKIKMFLKIYAMCEALRGHRDSRYRKRGTHENIKTIGQI